MSNNLLSPERLLPRRPHPTFYGVVGSTPAVPWMAAQPRPASFQGGREHATTGEEADHLIRVVHVPTGHDGRLAGPGQPRDHGASMGHRHSIGTRLPLAEIATISSRWQLRRRSSERSCGHVAVHAFSRMWIWRGVTRLSHPPGTRPRRRPTVSIAIRSSASGSWSITASTAPDSSRARRSAVSS